MISASGGTFPSQINACRNRAKHRSLFLLKCLSLDPFHLSEYQSSATIQPDLLDPSHAEY